MSDGAWKDVDERMVAAIDELGPGFEKMCWRLTDADYDTFASSNRRLIRRFERQNSPVYCHGALLGRGGDPSMLLVRNRETNETRYVKI